MEQNNNDNGLDITSTNVSAKKEDEIEMKDRLNEHGQPDFEFLAPFAKNGDPKSLEKLRSIADDLDVEFDDDTPSEELIEGIRNAIDSGLEITD